MIEKKDLLKELKTFLGMEEELLRLCERQLGNAAFFTGVPTKSRADVRAGLEIFRALSRQHRQIIEDLINSIRTDTQDVY